MSDKKIVKMLELTEDDASFIRMAICAVLYFNVLPVDLKRAAFKSYHLLLDSMIHANAIAGDNEARTVKLTEVEVMGLYGVLLEIADLSILPRSVAYELDDSIFMLKRVLDDSK